jgi:hypothetical protein
MNSTDSTFILLAILMFFFAYIFLRTSNIVLGMIELKRRRKIYSSLQKADDTVCKSSHTWSKASLLMQPLDYGNYMVCSECGFVGGTQYQLNKPGLEVFKNNLKIKEEYDIRRQNIQDRFKEIVSADMDLWIKTHSGKFWAANSIQCRELLEKFYYDMTISSEAAISRAENEFKEIK